MASGSERVRRLKWRCRRGMKELDLLLERFIETDCTVLQEGAWPEFEELLGVEDDVLWDWVQNPEQVQAAPYRRLLERIRHDSA